MLVALVQHFLSPSTKSIVFRDASYETVRGEYKGNKGQINLCNLSKKTT